MTTGPSAPQGPPAKRKKPHACTVIAALMGVGLLVVAGGVAYALHRVYQDPELRNVAEAVEEGVDIMVEARNAPGADELRELGCDEAMVLDVDRMRKLLNRFDAGAPPLMSDEPKLWVTCQVSTFRDAPSCDLAGRTFARAATPTEPFVLMVQKSTDRSMTCLEMYSTDGVRLGPPSRYDAGAH